MKQIYNVTGMTCNGCVASVSEKLTKINGVQEIKVNLEKEEVEIAMDTYVPLNILESKLPEKYTISEKQDYSGHVMDNLKYNEDNGIALSSKSKIQQLKPLLLIFTYLFAASFLLNYKDWNVGEAMLDFMGLFYIVFSFFKLLDLKGFPGSFRMYDPLAKILPVYGWVYPFIELGLGLLFLMRLQIVLALIATIVILGITTFGVTKTLLDKKSIRCACLGTALKLPMTEATFIENATMLVMAIIMLIQLV